MEKWWYATETSIELYRCKLHSELDNTSPKFSWYGKNTSIHELKTFGCDIYPITSSPKKLDDRTQKGSFMGYTNTTYTIKWWYPHTKKLKYFSSAKFDEHNNKFGKVWSLRSELMTGTNISTLTTLKLMSHINPLPNMIYLKSPLIYHQ